ncbi:hypothetical protein PGB90_009935 [Kerria lacca]
MPFFIRKPTKRKFQKSNKKSKNPVSNEKKLNGDIIHDDEVESDSSESGINDEYESFSEDEDKYLTVQEKKIKLAKKYLEAVENEEQEKLDANDDISKHVFQKLKENELEKAGKLKKKLADFIKFDIEHIVRLNCKQHKLSVTCLALSSDNHYLYTSSKDYSIVRWSLKNFQKLNFISFKNKKTTNNTNNSILYYNSIVNCLVTSAEDKYLISGNEKGAIIVWDAISLQYICSLQGHKNSISDLTICRETNSLYSTSKDALVKIWNLEELAYVETLFGHQSGVTSVDVLNKDRVVTSGGTDKTIRVWKIQEESQFIYNGHLGSIDVVKKLDEGFFISCGDDGALCLWGALKKKPLHVIENAHGICPLNVQPNWITALAVCPNSDLIASGSCDDYIRLWKWSQQNRQITNLTTIFVKGFVNALQFTADSKYLLAAIGKEHRLGRWQTFREAKNVIICIPLIITNNVC